MTTAFQFLLREKEKAEQMKKRVGYENSREKSGTRFAGHY